VTEAGAKILDFGLARITDADVAAATVMSEVGAIQGTLPYMSPEQRGGDSRDIDLRTDVYSLGVVLYELLSESSRTTRVACRSSRRSVTSARAAPALDVDADLQTIVSKALEKEPDGRYQSARHWARTSAVPREPADPRASAEHRVPAEEARGAAPRNGGGGGRDRVLLVALA